MGAADAKMVMTHASLNGVCAQSEAVVVDVLLTCKESRNCHRQISHKTRYVQGLSDAGKINYVDCSHEKLFTRQLPTHIVTGLVDNREFNGSIENNPFNF